MHSKTTERRQGGFTLIELSIVLVIVGLIIGSVLVGQDLVGSSELRMQISQIERYNVAVNAFKGKYACLPGDCAKAVDLGLGTSGGDGDNGDGNGVVDEAADLLDGAEFKNFWVQLGRSNMIEGTFTAGNVPGRNSPALVMPGKGVEGNTKGGVWLANHNITSIFNHADKENVWYLTTTTSEMVAAGVYLPMEAYRIDTKIDDGAPVVGTTRSITCSTFEDGPAWACSVSFGDTDACIDDTVTPAVYNTTSLAPTRTSLCAMMINAQF